jgi:hypothetical protein
MSKGIGICPQNEIVGEERAVGDASALKVLSSSATHFEYMGRIEQAEGA